VRAHTFWKTIVADRSDFLDRLLALLSEAEVRFCLIGGQAVNAYTEPVVSLDLDLVVAVEDLPRVETLLRDAFTVEMFPHSLNISDPGSALRVQVQTDPRYPPFVDRAELRDVLGLFLPVASIEDLLQGKVWAVSDATQRPSKRQKDLADIARLLESYPHLRERVPASILARLM
jgi:hypothetical protein